MDQVAFIADQIMGPTSSCSISGVNIVVFFIVREKNAVSIYISALFYGISFSISWSEVQFRLFTQKKGKTAWCPSL